MKIELIPVPDELADLLAGEALAVVRAWWRSEPRIIVLAGLRSGPRVYIVPPVPSPYCISKLEPVDEVIIKHVLGYLGVRVYSGCRVASEAVKKTVDETLKAVSELLGLRVGEEGADEASTQS